MTGVEPSSPSRPRGLPAWATGDVASPEVAALVETLVSSGTDAAAALSALHALDALTQWQVANQRAVLELGGVDAAVRLLRRSWQPPTRDGADTQLLTASLVLLVNVSAAEDVAAHVGAAPGCVAALVGLLSTSGLAAAGEEGASTGQARILAARCLVNITDCTVPSQEVVLHQVAATRAGGQLFLDKEDAAACKLGAWLLANLVGRLDAASRALAVGLSTIHQHAVAMASSATTPEATRVVCCRLLCALARAGPAAQTQLAQAGALNAMADAVAQRSIQSAGLMAEALMVLCALALDNAKNAAALAAHADLASALAQLLNARSSALESTWDDGRAVLATHTLLHVVGHMACNGGQGLPYVPCPWSPALISAGSLERAPPHRVACVIGPDTDLLDGKARLVVAGDDGNGAGDGAGDQVVYMSLTAAAQACGVTLPLALSTVTKAGEPAVSDTVAAELRHRISHVLLPRLQSTSVHEAVTAAAALYHLVAAGGGAVSMEARRLMGDAGLLRNLLRLSDVDSDASLVHACLAVLEVLAGEPGCGRLILTLDDMPTVWGLLDSSDALVRRWAERLLCNLYVATSGLPA